MYCTCMPVQKVSQIELRWKLSLDDTSRSSNATLSFLNIFSVNETGRVLSVQFLKSCTENEFGVTFEDLFSALNETF